MSTQEFRKLMLETEERAAQGLMLLHLQQREKEIKARQPRCAGCGTTKNLHRDLGSGGPYRCGSPDCIVF